MKERIIGRRVIKRIGVEKTRRRHKGQKREEKREDQHLSPKVVSCLFPCLHPLAALRGKGGKRGKRNALCGAQVTERRSTCHQSV